MLHPHLRYGGVLLSPSSPERAARCPAYLGMNTPRNMPPYNFPTLFLLWVIEALWYGGRGDAIRYTQSNDRVS